ncbi:hypothetical protein GCM10027051_21240 [Niabella terrae]
MIAYVLNGQEAQNLYFQPSFAIGAPVSKVFDEISYIPLETTKKSLFGRIRELVVSDQYYIIWDGDTNSIYFFDKSGRFIKKYRPAKCEIGNIQLAKNRNALFISGKNKHFSFSEKEVEKMMMDPTNKSFARFVWAGYYDLADVRREQVEELKDFSLALVNPTLLDAGNWAYSFMSADRRAEDRVGYELNVYDGRTTIRNYFPYNKKSDTLYYKSAQLSFFPTATTDQVLFTRPYKYDIYELTRDSVHLRYSLVMPLEYSLPKTFYAGFKSSNDFEQFRTENGSFVWSIEKVFRIKGLLFFSLDYRRSWRERNFMFEEAKGRFYNTGKISPDSSNAYLPALAGSILYADEEYLYSSVSSSSMFRTRDATERRSPQYSEAMKSYFENNDRNANPVIIRLQPKTTIE